jgi:hypothetical protein
MTKTKFDELQQSLGYNHNEDGILLDPEMSKRFAVIGSLMLDWMHVFVVHGIFQLTVGLMLNHFSQRSIGITHKIIHRFVSSFTWPAKFGGKSADGRNVFEKRSSGATYLQCAASEALAVYPVLELFCKLFVVGTYTVVEDAICECYFLLCDVMRMLQNLPNHRVEPTLMGNKIRNFLKKFLAVWGPDEWIPKCHMALHLHRHYLKHLRMLLSCWVHERKHKYAKNVANHLCNTSEPSAFEVPILEDILFHQKDMLSKDSTYPTTSTRLISPRGASEREVMLLQSVFGICSEVFTSNEAATGVIHFHTGDVALAKIDGACGVVHVCAHYSVFGTCISLVCPWTRLTQFLFTAEDEPVFIPTAGLLELCVVSDSITGKTGRYVVPCKF